MKCSFCRIGWSAVLALGLCSGSLHAQGTHGILREVFLNIGGVKVSDLTSAPKFVNNQPDIEEVLTDFFEAPTDVFDNYGQRLTALITAPETGDYTFWIASDDASELYLSTDETPANKVLIASVASWTASRQWNKEPNQKSSPVRLVQGRRYYIEALMKEGGGGDNLAVRWKRPSGLDEAPIPAIHCVPFGLGPPQITEQPSSVTVTEGGNATFRVVLARAVGATYQWKRNGVAIPGATSSTYTVERVSLSDSGARFRCTVVNAYGTTDSDEAVLTVTPDTTRPTLSLVNALASDTVTVIFSEPVETSSATRRQNYTLDRGAAVQAARMGPDPQTVVLSVTPLTADVTYTLTVNGVRDRATTPNTIAPNTRATFVFSVTPLDMRFIMPLPEQPGPSSRRSPVVISEIMYHPTNRLDGRNLEFIEIFNSQQWPEDISGWRISGEVDYTFPPNTTIGARSYVVVAANPADLQAVYGLSGVFGPFANSNRLDNASGTVRLRNELDGVVFEVRYRDVPPWPVAADGAGHSLVLARPSFGEDDPRAWDASVNPGGSPGAAEPAPRAAFRTIMINEILAHTDLPAKDFIELYNYSAQSVNLSGLWLSDDPETNKFRIPDGTVIPARGFVVFDEDQLGFALSSGGETIYLKEDGRVIDALRFEGQANGVAFGRYPDGAPQFHTLVMPTPGNANAPMLVHDVVINEIMYNPITGLEDDEYVELYNKGSAAIDLSGWKFTDGIDFTFPAGTIIPADGYLVVAKNAARLRTNYAQLNSDNCVGDFGGNLSNGGERIALSYPDWVATTNALGQWETNKIWIVADEVTYVDGGRWGQWSDGGGSSLELIDPRSDNRMAYNWRDSDETQKSPWVTLEHTGVLDLGNGSSDRVQLFLLDKGECLVDDVEVIPQGGGNLVPNPGFDNDGANWTFQGTHAHSSIEPNGGVGGGPCLHVRASARGDTGANRIWSPLTSGPAAGTVATLRCKVRWLKGHPELLLRFHGNWLEATTNHLAAVNLGTPGLRNTASSPSSNAGPAIADVTHTPIFPQSGQAAHVVARVHDPDGLASLVLRYRVDPSTNFVAVAMTNNGAGFFSARIPPQSDGTVVAFYIEASDSGSPPAASRFPNDAPDRECLIVWGEPTPGGTLGHYHLWLSQKIIDYWRTREKNSNEPLDCTFVYGADRVIYNAQTLYSGSPFHTGGYSSPLGNVDYVVRFPDDDPLLGHDDFVLATPGNRANDGSAQREQLAFWIARKLGVPWLYRRFVRLYVNGQQYVFLFEDAQQPNSDVIAEWFPNDAEGDLHKIEDWFEFDDAGSGFSHVDATLQDFTTTGGIKKLARYRWNWRKRAVRGSANNYTNLFALVDAMNAPGPEPYTSLVESTVDVDTWVRWLAIERMVGNWDSYGFDRGKNMYAYKPTRDRWALIGWDIDFLFDLGGRSTTAALFGGEPTISRFENHPPFRRRMWAAYQEAVNGPFEPNAASQRITMIYDALGAEGVSVDNPSGTVTYIRDRRNYILSELAKVDAPFEITSNNGSNFTTDRNLIELTGRAPVGVATIEVNGVAYPVSWTSVSDWTLRLALKSGANVLTVRGLDRDGQVLATDRITITYTGQDERPEDQLVINEIMYHPALSGAGFVEIHNRSSQSAFDLSGWRLDGVDFTFPDGTVIEPGGFLVVAADATAFVNAYGTTVPLAGVFNARLSNNGETIALVQPAGVGGATADTIIDEVTYDDDPPWPAAADGAGPSLQLIDPAQDNQRVINWAVAGNGDEPPPTLELINITNVWRYEQTRDLSGDPWTSPSYDDSGWPQGLALLYVESSGLPAPKNTPLTLGRMTYYFRTRFTFNGSPGQYQLKLRTVIDDAAVFYLNGQEIFRLGMNAGAVDYNTPAGRTIGNASFEGPFTLPASLLQPGENVFAVEVHQHSTTSSDIVLGAELIAEPLGLVPTYTPGAPNAVAATLPNIPPVWLNEVQADNLTGPTDRFGEHDPWVELYNAGAVPIDLSGWWLTDQYTNLTRWAIPTGTTLAPGEFKVIWLDGQPAQSAGAELHASFRLPSGQGSVALVTMINGTNAVVDYLNYSTGPNRSYGDFPDGRVAGRQTFAIVTPGAPNNSTLPPVEVFINEWLARNSSTLADPSDGDFEDWFELYNADSVPVDLSGYYVTDSLTNKFKWELPSGTVIPGHGFLLIWADEETGQNSETNADRHANFKLAADGEAIGLFTPDGVQIDAVVFGPQTNDVSEGRFPDGAAAIQRLTSATPRAPNATQSANQPPELDPIGPKTVVETRLLSFTATASDPDPSQALVFSLDPGAPAGASIDANTGLFQWIPSEMQGGTAYNVTIRVTDDGSPPMSAAETITITVIETNSPPVMATLTNVTVTEGDTVSFIAAASDPDLPPDTLTWSLDPGAPAGATIDPATGQFTWATTEADGTNTYTVTIRVRDNGEPAMETFAPVIIFVRESNQAPVITPIEDRTIFLGETVAFTAQATDPDIPPNALTWEMASAPDGATLDPATGAFQWTPTESQAPSTNEIIIRVTDDGVPNLTDTETFHIVVLDTNAPTSGLITLVPTNSVWKYLDGGADPGTAWREPDFDDSAWAEGPGKLGFNDNPQTTINIGPDGNRFITTYFRHHFFVANAAAFTNLAFNVLRDDGVVVYLNGTEIFRMNMPDGPVDSTTRAVTPVGGSAEHTYYPTNVAATALRPGENVLAVELHQHGPTTSDAGFDLELIGAAGEPLVPPTLTIGLVGGQVVLSWPAPASGWRLYTSPALGPQARWTEVPGPYAEADGQITVSLPTTEQTAFYRLQHP